MLVSETKIDDSFPQGQFVIGGFKAPCTLNHNCFGGGIMLFVREHIPPNLLTIEEEPIESSYAELNLHKRKWLVNCFYNPPKNSIGNHLDRISESLFIYYLFFIYSWLTANEITVYNKNSYVYIHASWRQLSNVEKMKNCKINMKKRKKMHKIVKS